MLRLKLAAMVTAAAIAVPGIAGADYYAGLKAFDAKQFAAAAQQWQRSASAGDAKSAFRLGKLYQEGRGVRRDFAKAYYWFKVAEGRGNADAGIAAHFVGRKLRAGQRTQLAAQARAFRPGAVAGNNQGNPPTNNSGNGGGASTDGGTGPFANMTGKELRRSFLDGGFHRSEIWLFNAGGQLKGTVFMTEGGSLSRTEQGADSGRWSVEGGRLCVQWKSWNDGRKVCYRATKVGKRWKLSGSNGRTTTVSIARQ